MKNVILIVLVLFPILSFSQNTAVVSFSGDTIIGTIHQTTNRDIFFTKKIKTLNSNRIAWWNVSAVLGNTERINVNSISKRYPDVKFDPHFGVVLPQNDRPSTNIKFEYIAQSSVGDHLKRSGYFKLTSLGISALTVALVSAGSGNWRSEQISAVAVTGSALALTFYVFGEINLIKAGSKMNKDALSLGLADQGLGVALRF